MSQIDYNDLTTDPIELPPRQENMGYERPPISLHTFVPEFY